MSSVWFYDDCCCPTTTTTTISTSTTPSPTTTPPPYERYCECYPVSYDLMTASECFIHYELETDAFPLLGLPAQKFYPTTVFRGYTPPGCKDPLNRYIDTCLDLEGCHPTCIYAVPYPLYEGTDASGSLRCKRTDYNLILRQQEVGKKLPGGAFLGDYYWNYLIPEQKLYMFIASPYYWDYGDSCCNSYEYCTSMHIGSRDFISSMLAPCTEYSKQHPYIYRGRESFCVYEITDDPIITFYARPTLFFPDVLAHHTLFGCADSCNLPAILGLNLVLIVKFPYKTTTYSVRQSDHGDMRIDQICTLPWLALRFDLSLLRYTFIQFPWTLDYLNPWANTRVFEFNDVPFGPEYELRCFCVYMFTDNFTCLYPNPHGDIHYCSTREDCPNWDEPLWQAVKQFLLSIRAKLIVDGVRYVCNIGPYSWSHYYHFIDLWDSLSCDSIRY